MALKPNKKKDVLYSRISVDVLWWDVSECIMVGCHRVYYGGASVSVLW